MKSILKLTRRFIGILFLSTILLLVLNIALLAAFGSGTVTNTSPWQMAGEVAGALRPTEGKGYVLPNGLTQKLEQSKVWAILIDNSTRRVVWRTSALPPKVPLSYTVSDIASLTRGYIDGYPTFTGTAENGLVVLGYPKDSYWKLMYPSWDYHLIANVPKIVLSVLAMNILLIFLIYMTANSKLLKSVKPIVAGIQALPTKTPVYIKEKGLLSELAMNINRTSGLLQAQSNQLRRKEMARANWIAGVSHDIRTPLSMVMGNAGQLKDDIHLTEDERKKAAAIVKQSERMKNLINDLNLASKLEYNMQPLRATKENMIAIVRQVVVDFINMGMNDQHPIEWETDETLQACPVEVDKDLIKRAIGNLIQNSINHNEQGCMIYVRVTEKNRNCIVEVSDNGVGATDEQIEKLNHAPHYMVCDENIRGQRHGLGLLIVKQIMAAHGGMAAVGHGTHGGFAVELILPILDA